MLTTKSSLSTHINNVHKRIKHKCFHCEKEFSQKQNLNSHIKSIHENKKKMYPCSLCDYQATTSSTLKTHIKSVHQGIKERCQICGKIVLQWCLADHIRLKHKESKTYPCDDCKKEYKSILALKHHYKVVHEKISYNCNFCEYTTGRKGNLKQHINSLHFQKRYPCDICDHEARSSQNLSRHVNNVHQKSQIVNCSDCGKAIRKDTLNTHKKMFHSEEIPTQYNCNICTYQTIHQKYLKKHYKTKHK